MPLIAEAIFHVVATNKGGSAPRILPLRPFFVAEVKSLGCLGKCARERGFSPRMAGLFALGHGCFPCLLVNIRRSLVPDMFGCVDVGGECLEHRNRLLKWFTCNVRRFRYSTGQGSRDYVWLSKGIILSIRTSTSTRAWATSWASIWSS